MADKKNPGRFTIQFNAADPQQRQAAELLERQGRRKAQFLTAAILRYVCGQETPEGLQRKVPDTSELETLILKILDAHFAERDFGSGLPDKEGAEQHTAREMPEDDLSAFFGPEAASAISNTLSAFCAE